MGKILKIQRLWLGAAAAAVGLVLVVLLVPSRAAAAPDLVRAVPASTSMQVGSGAMRPGFIVGVNGLRLRTGPSTSAPVRGLLYHGNGLLTHGWGTQRGAWVRVKVMRTGAVGFVWRGYTVSARFER
ncbi:SH3 domain-containing protein [Streptomyces sp. ITFR-6]|uniref:SH3 domain-containing protein n=1 Tax=Streptomyces sp. ITFR-6 TaxID=3075197 RepID=UPI00288BFA71|nr:SH3 domain-containing protein [Streptomyces sp. ITFR-6]WNI31372.1 SH3 domain-containing protein [Streptomyces sp. ITFR-6]